MYLRIRTAQTLMEAILAIAVILVSVISATALLIMTISAGQISEDKIVAANFAREGIEMVRAVRDSNWLKISTNELLTTSPDTPYVWNSPTSGATNLGEHFRKDYYEQFTPGQPSLLNLCSAVGCTTQTDKTNILIYRAQKSDNSGRGFFTQGGCSVSGYVCTTTKFSRIITIVLRTEYASGWNGEVDPATVAVLGNIDYLDVQVTVTWENHGSRTYTANERLYNWR